MIIPIRAAKIDFSGILPPITSHRTCSIQFDMTFMCTNSMAPTHSLPASLNSLSIGMLPSIAALDSQVANALSVSKKAAVDDATTDRKSVV